MAIKPILFNTEMVRAILDGRKSCTRRIVKPQPQSRLCYTFAGSDCGTWGYPSKTAHESWGDKYRLPDGITDEELKRRWKPPYRVDDILYVRETWSEGYEDGTYIYRACDKLADLPTFKESSKLIYHPSIHMPKEAARIWLKVTNVRVERLQEMKPVDVIKEGAYPDCWDCLNTYGESGSQCCYGTEEQCSQCDEVMMEWEKLWNSTIKKSDLDSYGWSANPYVWIIEFERCKKPEGA